MYETAMRECGRTVGEEAGEFCQDLALALRGYMNLVNREIGYFCSGSRNFKSLYCCSLSLL